MISKINKKNTRTANASLVRDKMTICYVFLLKKSDSQFDEKNKCSGQVDDKKSFRFQIFPIVYIVKFRKRII